MNIGDWFTDVIDSFFNKPSQAWDRFRNGRSNETNREIAEENLEYQRERNEIEDARYEEETAYNRAWAEDERDYARQLQQTIFDREDTALERQANSLSKLGINPLSQNMQGLGAGQVVSSAVAPSVSSRGGSALHNDFQMQDNGILNAISPIMSLINGIDNINTAGIQRDSLREQRDGQILANQEKAIDNLIKADKNDIKINNDGSVSLNRSFERKEQDFNKIDYTDKNASANRNSREDRFQEKFGVTDNTDRVSRIATDVTAQGERFVNGASRAANEVIKPSIKVLARNAWNTIKQAGKSTSQNAKRFGSWFKSKAMSPEDFEKMARSRY